MLIDRLKYTAFIAEQDLKCNYCESKVSFDDCDKNMKRVQCAQQFGLNRCMKIHIKASNETKEKFIRRCQTKRECEQPTCKKTGAHRCDVFCCTDDFCNDASVNMVSGASVLQHVAIAFFTLLLA